MSFTEYQSKDLKNDREFLGLVQESTLSSIVAIALRMRGNGVLIAYKKEIDGFTATLWSLVPLAMQTSEGDPTAADMLQKMITQVKEHIEDFIKNINTLSKIKVEEGHE